MKLLDITFTNSMGEFLAPFLIAVRSTGFFEAPVYMSVMTGLSIYLYVKLRSVLKWNCTFIGTFRQHFKRTFHVAYYMMCFITTNVIAVAFKTMIRDEMDYETGVWYLHLVSPLHFYIASITGAYLWLIRRNRESLIDRTACLYIQIGLLGGYAVGIYRLIYEPFDLLDVTTGVSGVFMITCFGFLNWDILNRFLATFNRQRTEASALQLH